MFIEAIDKNSMKKLACVFISIKDYLGRLETNLLNNEMIFSALGFWHLWVTYRYQEGFLRFIKFS